MRSRLTRLGDLMLSRVLPAAEAGACIPENGQKCKCAAPCGVDYCTQYYFNCTGTCVKHGSNRC
jgi:hypothetical protein